MFILFFVIFFIFLPKTVLAQIPTIDLTVQAHQTTYFQIQNNYQQTYNDYLEKNNINSKYKTITTQNDEFVSLKKVLISRNQLLSSYLSVLRARLQAYRAKNFEITSQLQDDLLNFENWLNSQNDSINSASTRDELNNWIKIFKEKYLNIQKTIYTSLVIDEVNLDLTIQDQISQFSSNFPSLKIDPELEKQISVQIQEQSATVSTKLENAYDSVQNSKIMNKYDENYQDSQKELDKAHEILQNIYNNLRLLLIKSQS